MSPDKIEMWKDIPSKTQQQLEDLGTNWCDLNKQELTEGGYHYTTGRNKEVITIIHGVEVGEDYLEAERNGSIRITVVESLKTEKHNLVRKFHYGEKKRRGFVKVRGPKKKKIPRVPRWRKGYETGGHLHGQTRSVIKRPKKDNDLQEKATENVGMSIKGIMGENFVEILKKKIRRDKND